MLGFAGGLSNAAQGVLDVDDGRESRVSRGHGGKA